MKSIDLITRERLRQVQQEKYNATHDDQQTNGGLAIAAACYAIAEDHRENYKDDSIPSFWPWQESAFKPSPDNRVKELIKAGALIAAEIDRLLRLESQNQPLVTTRSERVLNEVYDMIESRLNEPGEVRATDAWHLCRGKVSYNAVTVAFRQIMLTMIEQGKAQKIKNGHYRIVKANTPVLV